MLSTVVMQCEVDERPQIPCPHQTLSAPLDICWGCLAPDSHQTQTPESRHPCWWMAWSNPCIFCFQIVLILYSVLFLPPGTVSLCGSSRGRLEPVCPFSSHLPPACSVASKLLCFGLSLVISCLRMCGFPHVCLASLSVWLIFESGGLKAGWGF